ncbi:MAG: hypothetical protein U0640_08260 [Phycisphaerales bacterium]
MNTARTFGMVFAIATATMASSALAQHAGDIGIGTREDHIVTGVFTNGQLEPGTRVFGAEFGTLFPNFVNDPGFDSLPGTFSVPSSISFRIQKALRLWQDGQFGSVIPPEQISIGFGPATPVQTPLTDVVTPGFALTVGSNGQWHRHLEYTLNAPASDGIYLLEMTLVGNNAVMQESLPFWLVFNQNKTEAEHDEAIEWVIANLATEGPTCDSIDFNNDTSFFDPQDIDAFLSVYSEGPCVPASAACNDIDFNNDTSVFDPCDINAFLVMYSEGPCTPCGQ